MGGPLTILKHERTLFYQRENALPMNRTRCENALMLIHEIIPMTFQENLLTLQYFETVFLLQK